MHIATQARTAPAHRSWSQQQYATAAVVPTIGLIQGAGRWYRRQRKEGWMQRAFACRAVISLRRGARRTLLYDFIRNGRNKNRSDIKIYILILRWPFAPYARYDRLRPERGGCLLLGMPGQNSIDARLRPDGPVVTPLVATDQTPVDGTDAGYPIRHAKDEGSVLASLNADGVHIGQLEPAREELGPRQMVLSIRISLPVPFSEISRHSVELGVPIRMARTR